MATPDVPLTSQMTPTNTQRPPSLCIKPTPILSAGSPTSAASPPVSLTSKQWVVPPRPKPGRKPATDTPPTKRKAQNRAAQRAFRERRAARVGELEEQLKQIEDEHEQHEESLRLTIAQLEENLVRCQSDLASWINRCRELESQLADVQSRPSSRYMTQDVDHGRPPVEHKGQSVFEETEPMNGCGSCTLESHCQCIDDVVQAMSKQNEPKSQRAHTVSNVSDEEVKSGTVDHAEMEIDFTSTFANPPRTTARETGSAQHDPCGFCSDGTPCICAEMAAEQESRPVDLGAPVLPKSHRTVAQFTPPPSESDVSNFTAPPQSRCAAGPGTCAQCRADPKSTLFCKSLAAARRQAGLQTGCCGAKGTDGSCCQAPVTAVARKTRSQTAAKDVLRLPPPTSRSPVTLSCADAFTALSRHSAYEQASGDMGSWMPNLHANPAGTEGRPAMEIDAANVMAVLKDFDRRFGADK